MQSPLINLGRVLVNFLPSRGVLLRLGMVLLTASIRASAAQEPAASGPSVPDLPESPVQQRPQAQAIGPLGTLRLTGTFETLGSPTWRAAVHPAGKRVFTIDREGSCAWFEAPDWRCRRRLLDARLGESISAAFDPTSTVVLISTGEAVFAWDVAADQEALTETGLSPGILAVREDGLVASLAKPTSTPRTVSLYPSHTDPRGASSTTLPKNSARHYQLFFEASTGHLRAAGFSETSANWALDPSASPLRIQDTGDQALHVQGLGDVLRTGKSVGLGTGPTTRTNRIRIVFSSSGDGVRVLETRDQSTLVRGFPALEFGYPRVPSLLSYELLAYARETTVGMSLDNGPLLYHQGNVIGIGGHHGTATNLAFSKDGDYVAAFGNDGAVVADTRGKIVADIPGPSAFSPAGTGSEFLLVQPLRLVTWNARTGHEHRAIPIPSSWELAFGAVNPIDLTAWSSLEPRIQRPGITISGDEKVVLFHSTFVGGFPAALNRETETSRPVPVASHALDRELRVLSALWNDRTQEFVLAGMQGLLLARAIGTSPTGFSATWNDGDALRSEHPCEQTVTTVAQTTDGSVIASVDITGFLTIWDPADADSILATRQLSPPPLALFGLDEHTLIGHDGTALFTITIPSLDVQHVLVGMDGSVTVPPSAPTETEPIFALGLSPDRQRLAIARRRGVQVFERIP